MVDPYVLLRDWMLADFEYRMVSFTREGKLRAGWYDRDKHKWVGKEADGMWFLCEALGLIHGE